MVNSQLGMGVWHLGKGIFLSLRLSSGLRKSLSLMTRRRLLLSRARPSHFSGI